MTIQEAMIKIFDEHKKSMAEWEKIAGVSRQQIYRWKKGDVDNIRETSLVAVAESVGYRVVFDEGKVQLIKNESIEIDVLKKYISSLEDKIESLRSEVAELKKIVDGDL